MSVKPDNFADALTATLTSYVQTLDEGSRKAVDKTAHKAVSEIKKHITFKRGKTDDYVRSFALKKTKDGRNGYEKTWYVKAPHYRLTYLLEYGHDTPRHGSGRRTKAYTHIEYGEEIARSELPKLIEEMVEESGQ